MAEKAWWKRTFVYQIYPKSFRDTTGSGTGDIPGIISRLDYIKELGAGAVWITPMYPSPMVDNGYDISDYTSIDPAYGTMEDFDRLVSEAGKRGIRIVMDIVYNHSSDRHPWFLESKKDRTNPKADWYIWRDPKTEGVDTRAGETGEKTGADLAGGKAVPTNWRGIFGGSVWTWCEERQQYYYHTFAKEQPDLNWENPEVRRALFDAANFWLDKGIGGFRIDAISYIKKPAEFLDGKPDSPDGTVSVHTMTANTPGILDFLKEVKREVFEGHDIFTVGEACGVETEELTDWVGDAGVFSMQFEFTHVLLPFDGPEIWCRPKPWKLTDLKRVMFKSQEAVRDEGWLPIYFENHDRARSVNVYFDGLPNPDWTDPEGICCAADPAPGNGTGGSSGTDPENSTDRAPEERRAMTPEERKLAARGLAAVLFTLRGTPYVYQGEELGMQNADWHSPEEFNDISTKWQYQNALEEGYSPEEALRFAAFFSRDNARTPMQWDESENAGFSCAGDGSAGEGTGDGAGAEPWLPVHADFRELNAALEEADLDSVLHFYRKLAALRREREELISGSCRELLPEDEDIFCFERRLEDKCILIAVNFSRKEIRLSERFKDQAAAPGGDVSAAQLTEKNRLLLSSRRDAEPGILKPLEAQILE